MYSRASVRCSLFITTVWEAVFRIGIRSDPYHFAGSGDPGSKRKSWLTRIKINLNMNIIFFKEITYCLIHMNNKLINYHKKNIVMSIISFTEKNYEKQNWSGSGSTIPRSGSADPNPHQNEADPKNWWEVRKIINLVRTNLTNSFYIHISEKLRIIKLKTGGQFMLKYSLVGVLRELKQYQLIFFLLFIPTNHQLL